MKRSTPWLACLLVGFSATPLVAQSALDRLESQVRAGERPTTEADDASYLGALADDANEKLRGVRLLEVKPGGPADQQGLKAGDLVTAIDGEKVATLDQFAERMGKIPIGEKAVFNVERGDQKLSLPVRLGRRGARPAGPIAPAPIAKGPAADGPLLGPATTTTPPSATRAALPAKEGATAAEGAPRAAPLGIRLSPVDEAARIAQGQPSLRGGVVTYVAPGSIAERAGLAVDDVLFAVDGVKIESPDDAVRALARAKIGQVVKLSLYQRGERVERPLSIEAAGARPPADSGPALGTEPRSATPAGQTPRPFSQGPIVQDSDARIRELERNLADLQKRLAVLEETLRKFDRDAGVTKPADVGEEKPE